MYTRLEIARKLCETAGENWRDGERERIWLTIVDKADEYYRRKRACDDLHEETNNLSEVMECAYDDLHQHYEDSYHYTLDNIDSFMWYRCANLFLANKL